MGDNSLPNEELIQRYETELVSQEKSKNTISKYLRDIRAFYTFLRKSRRNGILLSKAAVMEYKEYLIGSYRTSSVNSMLVAVNRFLQFAGAYDCCVKLVKCQRRIFQDESRELTKQEYLRLIAAACAKGRTKLGLLMETICATGIRVSELRYITIESARKKYAEIDCKGKHRTVFLPRVLRKKLLNYCTEQHIKTGPIFCTASGRPLDRSNIWRAMKSLCHEAGLPESKVFPHNLRHLFARAFYGVDKDIVRLADILGHSSIETTRIYIISSGAEHARTVERLGLVV